MNDQKQKLILFGALTLLLSVSAFAQQPADMQTKTVQLAESSEGKQVQDAMTPETMDKNLRPPVTTEQQIQQQPDINKTISSELYSKRPNELLDKKVRNSNEEVIGKIKSVVSSRQDGQVHVVITRGGFLGIGATEYVVPLYNLSSTENALYLRSSADMNTFRQEYLEDAYVNIQPVDEPISEFSAFEERTE